MNPKRESKNEKNQKTVGADDICPYLISLFFTELNQEFNWYSNS